MTSNLFTKLPNFTWHTYQTKSTSAFRCGTVLCGEETQEMTPSLHGKRIYCTGEMPGHRFRSTSRALPSLSNCPDNDVPVALCPRSPFVIKPSISFERGAKDRSREHDLQQKFLRDSVLPRHLAGDHSKNKWPEYLVTLASAQEATERMNWPGLMASQNAM